VLDLANIQIEDGVDCSGDEIETFEIQAQDYVIWAGFGANGHITNNGMIAEDIVTYRA